MEVEERIAGWRAIFSKANITTIRKRDGLIVLISIGSTGYTGCGGKAGRGGCGGHSIRHSVKRFVADCFRKANGHRPQRQGLHFEEFARENRL